MPLLQINYSANLEQDVSIADLISAIHQAALATGNIETAALRTMAQPWHQYAIADQNEQNAFVHLIARMKPRADEIKRSIGDSLFAALSDFMDEQYNQRPLSLSMEIIDISTWRRNNMHDKLK